MDHQCHYSAKGNMNVYAKFHDSPSISCLDVSVCTKVVEQWTDQLLGSLASVTIVPGMPSVSKALCLIYLVGKKKQA